MMLHFILIECKAESEALLTLEPELHGLELILCNIVSFGSAV